jgi:hypothetical protein
VKSRRIPEPDAGGRVSILIGLGGCRVDFSVGCSLLEAELHRSTDDRTIAGIHDPDPERVIDPPAHPGLLAIAGYCEKLRWRPVVRRRTTLGEGEVAAARSERYAEVERDQPWQE